MAGRKWSWVMADLRKFEPKLVKRKTRASKAPSLRVAGRDPWLRGPFKEHFGGCGAIEGLCIKIV